MNRQLLFTGGDNKIIYSCLGKSMRKYEIPFYMPSRFINSYRKILVKINYYSGHTQTKTIKKRKGAHPLIGLRP